MGLSKTAGVTVRAISVAVPGQVERTDDLIQFDVQTRRQIIYRLGIYERRRCKVGQTQLDLCEHAAKQCVEELGWSLNNIDLLIFVTQTPDHKMPSNSSILHQRLSLNTEAECFDINQGCSGFAYSLAIASRMMFGRGSQRALICLGDASSIASEKDQSTFPLIGDAGACMVLETDTNAHEMSFSLGTYGKYYQSIMIENGGARNPVTAESFQDVEQAANGLRSRLHAQMDGGQVLQFSLSEVPAAIRQFLDSYSMKVSDFSKVVLHQPNRVIYDALAKKLSVNHDQLLSSLKRFGNTSSASIPLSIVSNLSVEQNTVVSGGFLCCGYALICKLLEIE